MSGRRRAYTKTKRHQDTNDSIFLDKNQSSELDVVEKPRISKSESKKNIINKK